jgi:hypothetical protein
VIALTIKAKTPSYNVTANAQGSSKSVVAQTNGVHVSANVNDTAMSFNCDATEKGNPKREDTDVTIIVQRVGEKPMTRQVSAKLRPGERITYYQTLIQEA